MGVDANLSFRLNELPAAEEEQVILIGSDGAWEVENEAGEQFGRERLRQILAATCELPPDTILKTMAQEIAEFRGGKPQDDDITLVVVKIW